MDVDRGLREMRRSVSWSKKELPLDQDMPRINAYSFSSLAMRESHLHESIHFIFAMLRKKDPLGDQEFLFGQDEKKSRPTEP